MHNKMRKKLLINSLSIDKTVGKCDEWYFDLKEAAVTDNGFSESLWNFWAVNLRLFNYY